MAGLYNRESYKKSNVIPEKRLFTVFLSEVENSLSGYFEIH